MFKKENLRRNFLRVKQNIDQNLGRAEKSEVLSEDQQENEKRVEVVKHAFQSISKKAGLLLQAPGMEYDKRLKKLPETGLGHSMLESAQILGPDTLLGSACQLCGDCQINLAKEQVQFEMTVEQDFVTPLQNVVDVDIPSIIKLRKNLSKSTLDMDSAKSRFNQAVRQSHVPGANMANAAAKADMIREEFEDASQKVENIKDNLSIELCNFAAKESEHSGRLLLLLEAQAQFHRKAIEAIEGCIPQMRIAIQNSPAKPCFGMPLEEHLNLMCRDIALVLEECVLTLLETGLEEEGLFRIAGAAIKLKKLKASFDANAVFMEEFSSDPHTVAGALKQYLRELPEPLLTFALYDDFMQAAFLPQEQRLQALWTVINKLPKPNYNNFRYLVKFLAKLAEKSDINKMKPSNIAIVMGPNLMWTEKSNAPNMLTTGTVSAITEAIVTHADWFFPGAFDFHETGQGGSPVKCRKPGFSLEDKLADLTLSTESKNLASSVKNNDGANPHVGSGMEMSFEKNGTGSLMENMPSQVKILELQSPGKFQEREDSSSDESNPFSSKFSEKLYESTPKSKEQLSKEEPSVSATDVQPRSYERKLAAFTGTDTGDYDNILYTLTPHHLKYPESNFNQRRQQGKLDSFGQAKTQAPPSRPSRLAKRHPQVAASPLEHNPLYSDEKTKEESCYPSSKYRSLERSAAGPSSYKNPLNRSTSDAHLYLTSPSQNPIWHTPNQKSDFNSLKRGSDPCLALPTSNFNNSSNQRPLKFSRSQLGMPPKLYESATPLSQMSEVHDFTRRSYMPEVQLSSKYGDAYPVSDTPRGKSFQSIDEPVVLAQVQGGNNRAPDYSMQVRAMWDQPQHLLPKQRAAASPEPVTLRDLAMSGYVHGDKLQKSGRITQMQHQGSKQISENLSGLSHEQRVHKPSGTKRQEIDFTNVGYHYEEDQDGCNRPKTPVDQSQPRTNNIEALHVQVTTSHGTAQYTPTGVVSPGASTDSPASGHPPPPSDSSLTVSSPIQRRATRKPAPPPPPERPFNVVVTATASGKTGGDSASSGSIVSMTSSSGSGDGVNSHGHQNKTAPLASPESSTEPHSGHGFPDREKQRISFHGERPSVPPPEKPERPRVPPLLNPPPPVNRGHQRSASTGAVTHQAAGGFENSSVAGVPNAGSLPFTTVVEARDKSGNQGAGFESVSSSASCHSAVSPGSSNTLGRHSSLRPRLTPPPPPPPIARQTEDTKL
ncbi:rho GTPase-activating protein 17 [Plakobranchus ocellatus]|uniref:Rho GTPase-activating protein 17 n=1 Tax=Plakobranchus ocellatus TaxID=259542 RepID=A0AAV4A1W3_9GAST|nr:rho GTPase-activating protein 17 [Plakobranchus ocellatus]